jgi:peptide/nickel transport system substrate-binding protein
MTTLTIAENTEPDGLNPLLSTIASSQYIQQLIFVQLLDYDPSKLELRPSAALDLPRIEALSQGPYTGGVALHYRFRPQAKWDNGKPITGYDYAFTLKATRLSLVHSDALRSSVAFIDSVGVDAQNPQSFTVYCAKPYFLAASGSGTLPILPEYHYDSKKVLRKFNLAQLDQATKAQKDLASFAEQFNTKYNRTVKNIVGGGPYRLLRWTEGKDLLLERKKNWWGNAKDLPEYLAAYPDQIRYVFTTDISSLLARREVDIAYNIPQIDFVKLINSEERHYYNFHSPSHFTYTYIGCNLQHPILKDQKVRRALAHLLDRDALIQRLLGGLGVKTNGPVHPAKPHYYRYLPDIRYQPDRAKQILEQAGWKDSNGDGILDKEINGQVQKLSLSFLYPEEQFVRRRVGEILQEEAKKIGINIILVGKPFKECIELNKQRKYDLYIGAWVEDPGLDNMRQIWHSQSDSPDGSNRIGFHHPQADQTIEQLERSLDWEQQKQLYHKLQEIIYEEQPYIFLFSTSGRIAIHWRFDKVSVSLLSPGFQPQLFKLNK